MNEKRFIMSKNVAERDQTGIIDVEKQSLLWVIEVVALLNEQQAEINRLQGAIVLYEYQLKVQDRTIEDLEKNIQELEDKINKFPPKIRELWIQD